MNTQLRGSPKKGEAPVWQDRGDAEAGEAFGRTILTDKFTHKPDTHPRPERGRVYDPNAERRRCPECGERGRWRRITTLGGWIHCSPAWSGEAHGDLKHECSALCGLRGVA